ncbi:MAG: hypothetical protein A7315_02135 [Candidatus Altiarchaeales archaeon WOR_SM1_79]|nr:MAG: hypothetical protein A7315_02135 [Candidatus Altiarchaeales archaeon WOR_SM1_79]
MKKINYLSLITILVIAALLFTCSPNEPGKKSQILVQPISLTFTKNVNSKKLIISNYGGGKLSWQITDKPDWIEVSKSSGKVTTGKDTVIVTADVNQELGTYSGTININSNGGIKDVTVTLDISIWTKMTDMPTARLGLGTALVDGKIYAIGGLRTEIQPLSTVEVYDPTTNTWTEKTHMPTARGTFGCAVVDGKIYAIGGGVTGSYNLSTVQMYDPATDTWTRKASMPTPRSCVAASTVNGKIYVIGGTKGESGILAGISTVEEYDPATDTWTRKKDMPTPRWSLGTCVVDGMIYAIGGNIQYPNIASAVEVYDPSTDNWTKKTSMPTARYSLATSSVNGTIFAFGGWRASGGDWGDPMYKKVEAYDPITDTWTPRTDMPFEIALLSTVRLNGKIYLIGGTKTQHPFTSINTVYAYDPVVDQ